MERKEPILFVRTQSSEQPMEISDDGVVRLMRNEEKGKFRNTTHFAVNAIVESHVYGTFEGAVALVAKPEEMGRPAGFGQVDTWFRHDEEGGLSLGRATIVAPEGVDVAEGARVVRYSGGIEERDAAIRDVLVSAGVAPRRTGFWGWTDSSMSEHEAWRRETTERLYGGSEGIRLGAHAGSLDERLEDLAGGCAKIAERVEEIFSENTGNGDVILHEKLSKWVGECRELLESIEGQPESFKKRVRNDLDRFEEKAEKAALKFSRPFSTKTPTASREGLSFEELEEMAAAGELRAESLISDSRRENKDFFRADDVFRPKDFGAPKIPPPLPPEESIVGLDGLNDRLLAFREDSAENPLKAKRNLKS